MSIEFIINGQIVHEDEIERTNKPKSSRAPKAEYHRGWFVEAYKHGQIAEAQRRHERLREDDKTMLEWSESSWMAHNRPKRISRMFAVREAAEQFASMATKQGFERVAVVAAQKGVIPAPESVFGGKA